MERMRATYDGSGGPNMSNDVDEGWISSLIAMMRDVPDTCVGETFFRSALLYATRRSTESVDR